jgi:hypothetical protein
MIVECTFQLNSPCECYKEGGKLTPDIIVDIDGEATSWSVILKCTMCKKYTEKDAREMFKNYKKIG